MKTKERVRSAKCMVLGALVAMAGAFAYAGDAAEASTYTVSYDGNGAAGTMANDQFIPGVSTNLTANAYMAVGYAFSGWTTNGIDVAYADCAAGVDFAEPGETLALSALWNDTGVEVTTFAALTNELVTATNQAAALPVTVKLTDDVVVPQGGVVKVYGSPAVTFAGAGKFDVSGIVPKWGEPVVVGEGFANEDALALFDAKGKDVKMVFEPEGGKVVLHARGETADFPWELDEESGVTAWVDEVLTNLAAVVIDNGLPAATNAIDLVALTNNMATSGFVPLAAPLNALVAVEKEDVTKVFLKPVNWLDANNPEAETFASLDAALAAGVTEVVPNFFTKEAEIPAEIVETGKGEDGKTYTAVVENNASGVESNAVKAVSVDGLVDVATNLATNVTLKVVAKDAASVDPVVAVAISNKLDEVSAGGFDSVAFVDLSVFYNAVQQENCVLNSLITLHIPWPVRTDGIYGVVRMHDGSAQAIPEGEANKTTDGEFFTVDVEAGEIVLRVKKFSDYAFGETEAEAEIGDVLYASLTNAVDVAAAGQTVTLLKDVELTEGVLVSNKTFAVDLGAKTVTFTNCDGFYFVGGDVTVSNGTVKMDAPATDNKFAAIGFEDADGLVKDVRVEAGNAKDGVVCCSAGNDFNNKTVVCKNVDVTGAGRNFYAETAKMTLDADCSATQSGQYAAGAVYSAALAAGWLGELEVNGGSYTATANVLATMSSPATITLNAGTFTGNVTITPVAPSYTGMGSHQVRKAAEVDLDAPAGYAWDCDGLLRVAEAKVGDVLYATLTNAVDVAAAGQTVTLLMDVALADTLAITNAIVLNLDGKTLSLAPNATVGIDVQAAATISNGVVQSTRAAYGEAYAILNGAVGATYADLAIDAKNYKFGLTCDSPDSDLADACTNAPTVTVTCQNVHITGNGTMFYAQHTLLNLDSHCSAIVKDEPKGYAAAVYSALNATITIEGGAYTNTYSLISGNFGGKIIVEDGDFNGDIKSYMKVGAHSELEAFDGYKASFEFNGGDFADCAIVFEDETSESRALDCFWKNLEAVTTLAAPAGYAWNESGVLKTLYYVSYEGGEDNQGLPAPIGDKTTDTFITDSPTNLTACGFTRGDFVFAGWKGWTNGVEVSYGDRASGVNFALPGETLALTAQWTRVAVWVAVSNVLNTTVSVTTNGFAVETIDKPNDDCWRYRVASNAVVDVTYRAKSGYALKAGDDGWHTVIKAVPSVGTYVVGEIPTVIPVADVLKIEDGVVIGWKATTADGVVTIPDGVTEIKDGAFDGAYWLKELDCSTATSLTKIGDMAFGWCTSLRKVTLPPNLKTVGANAFDLCASLTDVNLPETLETVGSNAFVRCYSLTNVVFNGNPPTVNGGTTPNYSMFYGVNGFTLKVPTTEAWTDDKVKLFFSGVKTWQKIEKQGGGVWKCVMDDTIVTPTIAKLFVKPGAGGKVTVKDPIEGLFYRVDVCTDLASGDWTPGTAHQCTPAEATAGTLELECPTSSGGTAFFRVTVSEK